MLKSIKQLVMHYLRTGFYLEPMFDQCLHRQGAVLDQKYMTSLLSLILLYFICVIYISISVHILTYGMKMSNKHKSYKSLDLVKSFRFFKELRKSENTVKFLRSFWSFSDTSWQYLKNADKLEDFMSKMEITDDDINTRKRMKTSVTAQLDEAVFI